jgi:hypothetical protein
MMLEIFWKAGHHSQQKYQSSPPEICVKKLQRDVQKYALQRLYPEDFEVRDMKEARLSPDQPQLCLACAWSQAQHVFSFDRRLMGWWKQPDRQLKGGFPPLS